MTAPPNPTGALVMCCRCRVRATFTVDAVCSTCRSAGAVPSSRPDEVKR